MSVLGIDIGGSGIKGCPVDLEKGELTADRYRIATPKPATPEAVIQVIHELIDHFHWTGPVGCGYPGVVENHTLRSAANLDDSLVGYNLGQSISHITGSQSWVLNDADAAGLAEVQYGSGKNVDGTVLLITVGTGLGTALFYNGQLLPNTELGHAWVRHKNSHKAIDAEKIAADSARTREDMSWSKWADNFSYYLKYMHSLLRTDLILIGGGMAKKGHKFMHHLKAPCEVRLAQLENTAGIVGAAAASKFPPKT